MGVRSCVVTCTGLDMGTIMGVGTYVGTNVSRNLPGRGSAKHPALASPYAYDSYDIRAGQGRVIDQLCMLYMLRGSWTSYSFHTSYEWGTSARAHVPTFFPYLGFNGRTMLKYDVLLDPLTMRFTQAIAADTCRHISAIAQCYYTPFLSLSLIAQKASYWLGFRICIPREPGSRIPCLPPRSDHV